MWRHGELYPETLAKTGPLPEGSGRIVLLRSDDFANRNFASPVYVRIREDLIGKLAHSGFLIAQVAAGDVAPKTVGVGDVAESMVVEPAVAGATGAAASAATAAVEGSGKRCAGPYRLAPLSEAAALIELPRLKSSH